MFCFRLRQNLRTQFHLVIIIMIMATNYQHYLRYCHHQQLQQHLHYHQEFESVQYLTTSPAGTTLIRYVQLLSFGLS